MDPNGRSPGVDDHRDQAEIFASKIGDAVEFGCAAESAGQIVGPAVISAAEFGGRAIGFAQDRGGPMATDVVKCRGACQIRRGRLRPARRRFRRLSTILGRSTDRGGRRPASRRTRCAAPGRPIPGRNTSAWDGGRANEGQPGRRRRAGRADGRSWAASSKPGHTGCLSLWT